MFTRGGDWTKEIRRDPLAIDSVEAQARDFDASAVALEQMTGQTPAEDHQQGQKQQAPEGGVRGHGGHILQMSSSRS